MRNALTFDLEEYFQVEAFTHLVQADDWPTYPSRVVDSVRGILSLLGDRGVTATFFVLGWIADRHPALLREIHAQGHELACHGYAHRMIYTMTPEEFRDDVRRAKQAIERAAGATVTGYRAPTFSIVRRSLWALDVLAEEGFRYDSSIFPIRHDRYGMAEAPRFPHRIPLRGGGEMAEFPMTTVPFAGQNVPFCGGGYFRLWPYRVVRTWLRYVNDHEGQPGIVYLHPWEFDPEQPRLPVKGLSAFRHYVNLRGTATKLEGLLDDFAFAPATEVLHDCGVVESRR